MGRHGSVVQVPMNATRSRTYVAFDGDSDLMSYRTLQRWSADPRHPFHLNDAHDLNVARDDSLPQSIIAQLRERLSASRHVVLLVGEATARNRRGILQYELRYAIAHRLPILVCFIGLEYIFWEPGDGLWERIWPKIPPVLRNHTDVKYCVLLPLSRDQLTRAIYLFDHRNLPAAGYSWFWR